MSRIFTTTLRLNLDNEEDRRAWEYLQHRDRKQYRSYSSAVVAAVNDHFSRQEKFAADPFLENEGAAGGFSSGRKGHDSRGLAGLRDWSRRFGDADAERPACATAR